MDNIFKNIYLDISAEIAIELLEQERSFDAPLLISVPNQEAQLTRLYKKLSEDRSKSVIFYLASEDMSASLLNSIARFFFLTTYSFKNNSPIIAFKDQINGEVEKLLTTWCLNQGFDEPFYCKINHFDLSAEIEQSFVFVPSTTSKDFLVTFFEKVVALEWLSQKFVLQVSSIEDINYISQCFEDFSRLLQEKYSGVLMVLGNLTRLENEIRRNETVIRFQEIEINNHKLYNSLLRGVTPIPSYMSTVPNFSTEDVEKLKRDCSNLFIEIGKLRNDLSWYQRTYEERSVLGIVKERLLKKTKNK